MELIKKEIRTSVIGKTVPYQFVLNDDFNVPDASRDVDRVLTGEGIVRISEVKRVENYVRVAGTLQFKILCVCSQSAPGLEMLEGSRPFEEMIYTEEEGGEYVVQPERVDFTPSLVHSRKLGVRAMIELSLHTETSSGEQITTDVDSGKKLLKKQRELEPLELFLGKRDVCRIKEEVQLPGTRENIGTLIWQDVSVAGMDTRLAQDALLLSGELQVFCIYESQEGKLDWTEQNVPFESRVECPGVDETMYHHVYRSLGDTHVEARMDGDGEMRALGIEAAVDLRILVYREEKLTLLEDVYSLDEVCRPAVEEKILEELVMQNHFKNKITEHLDIPELREEILQICHAWGMLQTENLEVTEGGIRLEGILHIHFLYIKADDAVPFGVWQGMVPVSCLVESGQGGPDMRYDVTCNAEQTSVSLAGSGEVEVKAVLAVQSFFRRPVKTGVITDLEFTPLDEEARAKIPGIAGYIVKDGEDLWDLAKRYLTTVDSIREMNGLSSGEVKPGDKILIFKENTGIL